MAGPLAKNSCGFNIFSAYLFYMKKKKEKRIIKLLFRSAIYFVGRITFSRVIEIVC